MKWSSTNAGNPASRLGLTLFLTVGLVTGCDREDAKVYRVPKESPPGATAELPAGHPDVGAATARPRLTWTLPAGWTELPAGEMRVASFRVAGADGKQADVSVIPLAGMAGGDAANVNRWRGQVGLASETEAALRQAAQVVEVGGQSAELHDVAGTNPGDGSPTRILAVILHRDGTAWFFKMTGDDALVAQQKPALLEFLKSFQFATAETAAMLPPSHPPLDGNSTAAPASAAPATEGRPQWTVPAGWKEVPGGQFLVAKFAIAGDAGAAAVNVSRSVGDGGGLAANVNRWRGQLGQPPWSAAELEQQAKQIAVTGGTVTVVEMTGTDARSRQPTALTGAMVLRDGQTWFYKLMGDAPVVAGQKEVFLQFVQGVKY